MHLSSSHTVLRAEVTLMHSLPQPCPPSKQSFCELWFRELIRWKKSLTKNKVDVWFTWRNYTSNYASTTATAHSRWFPKVFAIFPWVLLPPYAPGQVSPPTDLQEQIESGCSNKNRRAGPKGDLTYHGKCVRLLAGTLHYTYLAGTPILNSAVRLHS